MCAEMAFSLLSQKIDRKHRAAKLEASPGCLSTLVTRGPTENWQIHPAWVQRYKYFLLFVT